MAAFFLYLAMTCYPACAPGQTCFKWESASGEGYACEGTPDDCRTNGCQADHHECVVGAHENDWTCRAKACVVQPTWADVERWLCAEWADSECCVEWRYEER